MGYRIDVSVSLVQLLITETTLQDHWVC